jgi:hypothetical protein
MSERDNEKGIQANRPAQSDARIQGGPPLPEPLDFRQPPSPAPPTKPFRKNHPLIILIAISMLGATIGFMHGWRRWNESQKGFPRPPEYLESWWIYGDACLGSAIGFGAALLVLLIMKMTADAVWGRGKQPAARQEETPAGQ